MLMRIVNWALEGLCMIVFLVIVILSTYVMGQ